MIEPEKNNNEMKNKNDQAAGIILEILEIKDTKSYEFQDKISEILRKLKVTCGSMFDPEDFRNAFYDSDPMLLIEFGLQLLPEHLELLQYYTEYLAERLVFRRAIPYLQKIVELEPDSCQAWDSLGYSIFKANNASNEKGSNVKLGDPEKCFKKALELDESYSEAWLDLGMFYKHRDRFEEAIACLEKLVELNEGKDFALFQLGYVHQTIGNGDVAMEFYKKSLDLNPTNDIAWNNLGREHANRFEFKDAIKMYLRALQFDDKSHVTWENLKFAFMGNEQQSRSVHFR